jgi:hypothetical protein
VRAPSSALAAYLCTVVYVLCLLVPSPRNVGEKKNCPPAQISSKKEEETMEQQGTTTRLLPICLLHRINSAWKKEPARLKGKRDNTNAMARTTPHQIPVRSPARSAGELYYIGTCYRRHGSLIRYWPRYYMRHWPRFSISPAQ